MERPLSPTTKALHASIIRCLRGILSAWEDWLKKQ